MINLFAKERVGWLVGVDASSSSFLGRNLLSFKFIHQMSLKHLLCTVIETCIACTRGVYNKNTSQVGSKDYEKGTTQEFPLERNGIGGVLGALGHRFAPWLSAVG